MDARPDENVVRDLVDPLASEHAADLHLLAEAQETERHPKCSKPAGGWGGVYGSQQLVDALGLS
jgi:hypothetical protein